MKNVLNRSTGGGTENRINKGFQGAGSVFRTATAMMMAALFFVCVTVSPAAGMTVYAWDNPAGRTVPEVQDSVTMDYNWGTVTTNNGEINHNYGAVTTNNYYISVNYAKGTVTTNNDSRKYIDQNYGAVITNNGLITANYDTGTVTINFNTITKNIGTVTTNNGSITDNLGTVIANNNKIGRNSGGTVKTNKGTVDKNTNNGTVHNYAKGVVE